MGPLAADPFAGSSYRGLERIGRGGMGEVWEVERTGGGRRDRGRRFAAKLLIAPGGEDVVERFKMEVKVLARLESQHVVAVSDVGVTPRGEAFYVMERLRGCTLRELLARRGRLPVEEAVELVAQALRGLGAAHALGVVHRDIKLDNLFLLEPPVGDVRLKVLDFGVAKVVGHGPRAPTSPMAVATEAGVLIGTPRFASPEQILGQPVDARSDLYAMGLVLHHLVTGKGPFDDARDLLELSRAHVATVPPPPSAAAPGVPPWLDAIVARALAKTPSDRFPDTASFLLALERGGRDDAGPDVATLLLPVQRLPATAGGPPVRRVARPAARHAPARRRRLALLAAISAVAFGAMSAALLHCAGRV